MKSNTAKIKAIISLLKELRDGKRVADSVRAQLDDMIAEMELIREALNAKSA
jgi:hypothetical protein